MSDVQTTTRVPISDEQRICLEWLIWRSRDASAFARKCAIWLIRESHGLTRMVRLKLEDPKLYSEVAFGFHDMSSSGCTTLIGAVLGAAGSTFSFDKGGIALLDYHEPYGNVLALTPTIKEIDAVVPPDSYVISSLPKDRRT